MIDDRETVRISPRWPADLGSMPGIRDAAMAEPRVRPLPNLRVMVTAFAVSLGVGVLQLLISWGGGIALNDQAAGDPNRLFIGYLSSYHWWMSYMIIVPVIIACACPTWTAFAALEPRGSWIARSAVLATSFTIATALVMSEVRRAVSQVPLEACQWNYLHCKPQSGPYSPTWRGALMVMGYLHELLGYGGLLFAVVGATVLSWRSRNAGSAAMCRRMAPILLNQRLCVLAYLGYLILLRSSKVHLQLILTGHGRDAASVVGMVSHWGSQLSAISTSGDLTLALGGIWIVFTIASHLVVAYAGLRHKLPDDTYGIWLVISEAATIAGRPFLFSILGATALIALPPPGWVPLVSLTVVIAAFAVLWRQRTERQWTA